MKVISLGRQHRKDIDLYLKPFRGNNNIINLYINVYILHTKKMYNFLLINIYYYYYYYLSM